MKYVLAIYVNEAIEAAKSLSARQDEMSAYFAFTNEVRQAGVYIAGEALYPTSSATTVRVRDEKTLSTDGPFAETKGIPRRLLHPRLQGPG